MIAIGKLLLSIKEDLRHVLDQIVDENPQPTWSRQASGAVIWLEDQTHLLQEGHIISDRSTAYSDIMFLDERFRPGDISCLDIFLNDEFEDLDLPSIDLLSHILGG